MSLRAKVRRWGKLAHDLSVAMRALREDPEVPPCGYRETQTFQDSIEYQWYELIGDLYPYLEQPDVVFGVYGTHEIRPYAFRVRPDGSMRLLPSEHEVGRHEVHLEREEMTRMHAHFGFFLNNEGQREFDWH